MKRFLPILFILIMLYSCRSEENPIPNSRVYLRLDTRYEDKELRPEKAPSYKIYTNKDANIAQGEFVGYGGIIVVNTTFNGYKAFDLACPYEMKSTVSVAPDSTGAYLVCPVCSTKYDIAFGTGAPNGVSTHYLKQYTVTQNGDILIVSN